MKQGIAACSATVATAAALAANRAEAQVGDMPNREAPIYHGHDMMWGGDQFGGIEMVLVPISMIVILLGMVAVVIYVARYFFGETVGIARGKAAHDRALILLKERYAKGEIDTQEFQERKLSLAE